MYFKDITDEELTQFHNKVHINYKTKISNILNNDLFEIEQINDLIKIIPLFYFDNAYSSNSNDKLIDNKLFLCEYKGDTELIFDTNDKNLNCGILTYDENDTIIIYLYNQLTGKPIADVTAHIQLIYTVHGSTMPIVLGEFDLKLNDGGILYYILEDKYKEIEDTYQVNAYIIEFIKDNEVIYWDGNTDWR